MSFHGLFHINCLLVGIVRSLLHTTFNNDNERTTSKFQEVINHFFAERQLQIQCAIRVIYEANPFLNTKFFLFSDSSCGNFWRRYCYCSLTTSRSTITVWFERLKSGKLFTRGDYYSLMVFCDFINFLISVRFKY